VNKMNKEKIINLRHSTRSFKEESLTPEHINVLMNLTKECSKEGVHFDVKFQSEGPFKSFLKTYGMFFGVKNYIICTIDETTDLLYEKSGYYGEKLVLGLTEIGISTCFVGGTYDDKQLETEKRVISYLIPFGYELDQNTLRNKITKTVLKRKLRDASYFMEGEFEKLPLWLQNGIHSLIHAPSALNQQNYHLNDENDSLYIKTSRQSKYAWVDLGIAKYQFEYICENGFFDSGSPALFHIKKP